MKHALPIDTVTLRNGAVLGMSRCPGWRRGGQSSDLDTELRQLRDWGASTVLSLVQAHEFARLGVPGFADAVARAGLTWLHVPVVDMTTPDASTQAAWLAQRAVLRDALQRGDKVLVHCAFGMGRTGTMVARLLVDDGLAPDEAIARVRRARPGTVETAAQARFVAEDRIFTLRG
jgi:protein-tyrosine phosphatase